jgi:hypothetical protein
VVVAPPRGRGGWEGLHRGSRPQGKTPASGTPALPRMFLVRS